MEDQDLKRLSDDWRHRDQLTWQLPSVLVAVSGALVSAVFALDLAEVKNYLLWGGVVFAGLLSTALAQNIYFQTVAEDLMDARETDNRVKGHPLPRRRTNGSTSVKLFGRSAVKIGSSGLFLLSVILTGFLGFLAGGAKFEGDDNYAWWVGTSLISLSITMCLNYMVRGGLVCLNSAARFDKWNRAAVR